MPPKISSNAKEKPKNYPKYIKINNVSNIERLKMYLIPCTIIGAAFISWTYNVWLSKLVNTPLNEPKIIDEYSYTMNENLDRFWGSYRSHLYFGLKTRSSDPLNAGLMWFNQYGKSFNIRHWCDHNDKMRKYGWLAHDGRNFGIHNTYESIENPYMIQNKWIKRHGGKHGGDWTVNTKVVPKDKNDEKQFVSMIFYFGTDYTGWIKSTEHTDKVSSLEGETLDVGNFNVKIDLSQNKNKEMFLNRATGNISLVNLKDSLLSQEYFYRASTKSKSIPNYIAFQKDKFNDIEESNFIAYQISGFLPFEFDVIFESQSLRDELKKERKEDSPPELKGEIFENALTEKRKHFNQKFENIFKLNDRNFSENALNMARETLSNVVGGIGFFYGRSIVKSLTNKENVFYWPAYLYTGVPSRSFFPRGFLWDEGFHNILISQWDLDITKDIIGHWLDLMNIEGWIPREVILGDEAISKVPPEFIVQNNAFANPPTLFLPFFKVIHKISEKIESSGQKTSQNPDVVYLKNAYKRLGHWYDWFNKTQIGKVPFSYRWRGRVGDSRTELNPKTLTSGLDDFPRASHPNDQERHLDLRCWMAWASKVMGDLSEIIGVKDSKHYKDYYNILRDNKVLDELHWSNTQYADYGLHSDKCKLVRDTPQDKRIPRNSLPFVREVITPPKFQYVNSVGYVSLFPLILELIDADSPKLNLVLDQIKDPKQLWTNYGLRSLSKKAPLYDKKNTEHDAPYWRGAIWININYLTLKSLKFYSTTEGPYQEKAEQIYTELRANIINNIQSNYEKNGYIWEQYNDNTGQGQGTHPFTGWSSLVVCIMAEIY